MKGFVIYWILGAVVGTITSLFFTVYTWQFWVIVLGIFLICQLIEHYLTNSKEDEDATRLPD